MIHYCWNDWCHAEASMVAVHTDGTRTYLCGTCADSFELGQACSESELEELVQEEKLTKKQMIELANQGKGIFVESDDGSLIFYELEDKS